MRLMTVLFRNSRQPQNEVKVPLKSNFALKLKNYVSKNEKVSERGCLYEISMFLTCLEENEFQDRKCTSEYNVLQKCYTTYMDNVQRLHKEQEQVVPIPNSKNFTPKQITHLLRKYPTV